MATTDPKTATEGQWQDLANRVQSKAEIGTVLSAPSSVAYVDTANLVDESVTAEKLGLSYSTSEQITGEKWIDGKTIYRKTIDLGNLPSNNTTRTTDHNVVNLDTVVKIEGMAFNNVNSTIPLPYVGTSDFTTVIRITANRTEIAVQCGTDRSSYHGYATLYYTKNS